METLERAEAEYERVRALWRPEMDAADARALDKRLGRLAELVQAERTEADTLRALDDPSVRVLGLRAIGEAVRDGLKPHFDLRDLDDPLWSEWFALVKVLDQLTHVADSYRLGLLGDSPAFAIPGGSPREDKRVLKSMDRVARASQALARALASHLDGAGAPADLLSLAGYTIQRERVERLRHDLHDLHSDCVTFKTVAAQRRAPKRAGGRPENASVACLCRNVFQSMRLVLPHFALTIERITDTVLVVAKAAGKPFPIGADLSRHVRRARGARKR